MAFMFLPQVGNRSKSRWRAATPFELRLLVSVLLTGFPAVVLCLILLWTNAYSIDHKIEGTVLMMVLWLGLSFSARNSVVRSILVLSNVVSSLKEEDFSLRAPDAFAGDALGDLALEINNLARALELERCGSVEAETLLRKVIEVEGVVLALTPDNKVKLYNQSAASFLGRGEENLLGRTVQELAIEDLVEGPPSETISRHSGDIEKRWIVRRTIFRQQGVPHRLIMLSEASEALRAEERLAWQRVVRVLGHEINNSLAPIKSVARTLARITANVVLPPDTSESLRLGLDVISTRAESLNRFIQGYARLTKLPPPTRRNFALRNLVDRVIGLEPRLAIEVLPGQEVQVNLDPDQLEQALINLTRNAVDAVLMKPHRNVARDAVTVSWAVSGEDVKLWIRDRGMGLLDDSNLFVPFYTTKETGTGIGLVLTRQIIEAHGGRLMVRNRADCEGCEVEIHLPNSVAARGLARPAGLEITNNRKS